MAGFSYNGMARINWDNDKYTEQYISYNGDTGILRVYNEGSDLLGAEWWGYITDHPARHITFLHRNI
jgi:hypothetical protein